MKIATFGSPCSQQSLRQGRYIWHLTTHTCTQYHQDYKDDVLRGVLKKHRGFPDLPPCPTEGLWGSYRAGYEPGQPGVNCRDTAIQAHVMAQRQTSLSVDSWNKLWKQDLKSLKRKREYAELTKGLWDNVDKSANMAYYVPSDASGSMKAFYERPQGEDERQNFAHANGLTPGVGEYYDTDFHFGQAEPVENFGKVYGNAGGTNEAYGMRPIVQVGFFYIWRLLECVSAGYIIRIALCCTKF
jgi:hypothetical protein